MKQAPLNSDSLSFLGNRFSTLTAKGSCFHVLTAWVRDKQLQPPAAKLYSNSPPWIFSKNGFITSMSCEEFLATMQLPCVWRVRWNHSPWWPSYTRSSFGSATCIETIITSNRSYSLGCDIAFIDRVMKPRADLPFSLFAAWYTPVNAVSTSCLLRHYTCDI